MINVQRTHPVASLDTSRIATWWISKRRVEAVSVPVLAAVVAGNDSTLSEGRLVTSVAEDTVALAVLEFVIIWSVVVSATARLYTSAKAQGNFGDGCAKLPSLGLDGLCKLAIFGCRNALKVVPYILWQSESFGILLV